MKKRSELRQLAERGSHDPGIIYSILDAGRIAHVGFIADSQPFVIPMIYGRRGGAIYLHGSAVSRLMNELSTGIPACLTVTLLDGMVLARSAFHHAMNYRSVVAIGSARTVSETAQKVKALYAISEHMLAGRWKDVRGPSREEIEVTSVVEFSIEEASAKIRRGPPIDNEDDYSRQVWAGVLPFSLEAKAPVPDPRLNADVELPPYLDRFAR